MQEQAQREQEEVSREQPEVKKEATETVEAAEMGPIISKEETSGQPPTS